MNITDYLVSHGYGTVIWTSLVFILLFLMLTKFAWKPILGAVKIREEQIAQALAAANLAQQEVEKIKATNQLALEQARMEREALLREAKAKYDQMMVEARQKAEQHSMQLMEETKKKIELEKNAAVDDLKNLVANFSLEIAELILSEKLTLSAEQQRLVEQNIDHIHFN